MGMQKLNPNGLQAIKSQCGSTALGIVIGVAISLLVVAAGAVWYAKAQSPVVNRVNPTQTLSETEEAQKNKDWNPNGGLFTKPPPASLQALAASAMAAASSPVAAEAGVDKKSETPNPAAAASTPNAGKVTGNDPIGDLVKAKAQGQAPVVTGQLAKPTEVKNDEALGVFYVQAGAFKLSDDANAQKARLAILGIETKVSEREQSGKPIYRVRAGPFTRAEDAESMKSKLEKAGFDAALVKSPK
jgi:cell division protein FtsN